MPSYQSASNDIWEPQVAQNRLVTPGDEENSLGGWPVHLSEFLLTSIKDVTGEAVALRQLPQWQKHVQPTGPGVLQETDPQRQ